MTTFVELSEVIDS